MHVKYRNTTENKAKTACDPCICHVQGRHFPPLLTLFLHVSGSRKACICEEKQSSDLARRQLTAMHGIQFQILTRLAWPDHENNSRMILGSCSSIHWSCVSQTKSVSGCHACAYARKLRASHLLNGCRLLFCALKHVCRCGTRRESHSARRRDGSGLKIQDQRTAIRNVIRTCTSTIRLGRKNWVQDEAGGRSRSPCKNSTGIDGPTLPKMAFSLAVLLLDPSAPMRRAVSAGPLRAQEAPRWASKRDAGVGARGEKAAAVPMIAAHMASEMRDFLILFGRGTQSFCVFENNLCQPPRSDPLF